MTTLEVYDKALAYITQLEADITTIEAAEYAESLATDENILGKFYDWLLNSRTTLKELVAEIENLEDMPETGEVPAE